MSWRCKGGWSRCSECYDRPPEGNQTTGTLFQTTHTQNQTTLPHKSFKRKSDYRQVISNYTHAKSNYTPPTNPSGGYLRVQPLPRFEHVHKIGHTLWLLFQVWDFSSSKHKSKLILLVSLKRFKLHNNTLPPSDRCYPKSPASISTKIFRGQFSHFSFVLTT